MTIYLYLKTHSVTGLKYLGKTTSKDPYTYRGSGKYWKEHIKKHGYDVKTQILLSTESEEELKETGLFFSRLWNIVESGEWANLKPEEGDGGSLNLFGGDVQRQTHAKRIKQNGYHHLKGGTIQKQSNQKRVKECSHNFLGSTNNSKRIEDGTHNFLGGSIQKKIAQEKVKLGVHPMQNTIACIDENGNLARISKDEYYSQDKSSPKYVHIRTKEAAQRKASRKPI